METEVSTDDLPHLPPLAWLVRPCEHYKEEYKECRSLRGKFHQYFLDGETQDCTSWYRDHQACLQYRNNHQDLETLATVIESEKERRRARLAGHYGNDVWEKREAPPEDWNKPLPDYMPREPNSYLAQKAADQKAGKVEGPASLCTIS